VTENRLFAELVNTLADFPCLDTLCMKYLSAVTFPSRKQRPEIGAIYDSR